MGEMMKLEYCIVCNEPTGKAGIDEDSLYDTDGSGPYCEHCFERYALAALEKREKE